MEKTDFYKILCTSTPEEINNFISSKGKKKMVNAITFVDEDYKKESSNDEMVKNISNKN